MTDRDGDGVNDDIDALATDPSVTSGFLEEAVRNLADLIDALDRCMFIGRMALDGGDE